MRDMVHGGFQDSVVEGQVAPACRANARLKRGDALSGQGVGPVQWRHFGFDHGGNCYGFETTRIGDRSRIVINGKAALELPRAVWDALLDAVRLQRRLSASTDAQPLRQDVSVPSLSKGSQPTPFDDIPHWHPSDSIDSGPATLLSSTKGP